MINDRPIKSPRLQACLNDVKRIIKRYNMAGTVMIVAPEEAAFAYVMTPSWSAWREDTSLPLGFRLRARSSEDGPELTHKRVEGAMHTICQFSDFGEQTTMWMEDLKLMARRAGIDFHHNPFNGNVLPHLTNLTAEEQKEWDERNKKNKKEQKEDPEDFG